MAVFSSYLTLQQDGTTLLLRLKPLHTCSFQFDCDITYKNPVYIQAVNVLKYITPRQDSFLSGRNDDAIMTYKCMNGQAPSYLCSKIINMCEQTHRYNTRFQSSGKIKQQLCRTSTGQRSFLLVELLICGTIALKITPKRKTCQFLKNNLRQFC